MTTSQDRTAFVEHVDVVLHDRRTERQRRRVAETRRQALELMAQARLLSDALQAIAADSTRHAERDARALRSRVDSLRKRAAAKKNKADVLEHELGELEARARHAVTFRLHSATHYIDLTEAEYERLSGEQRRRPVLIHRSEGRQWWWYRDRFWWDDANLGRSQFVSEVLESDLDSGLERHLAEETRGAILRGSPPMSDDRIPIEIRRVVWRQHEGKCCDCGSAMDLRFEWDEGDESGSPRPEQIKLRCRMCSALRAQPRSRSSRR